MAIVLYIGITNAKGNTDRIGVVEIRRLEPLDDGDDHSQEVHPYMAERYFLIDENSDIDHQKVSLNHRYGDGVLTLISNAMAAFGSPESDVR